MLVLVHLRFGARPIDMVSMPMGVRGSVCVGMLVRVIVLGDDRFDGRVAVLRRLLMNRMTVQHRSTLQARRQVCVQRGGHGRRALRWSACVNESGCVCAVASSRRIQERVVRLNHNRHDASQPTRHTLPLTHAATVPLHRTGSPGCGRSGRSAVASRRAGEGAKCDTKLTVWVIAASASEYYVRACERQRSG